MKLEKVTHHFGNVYSSCNYLISLLLSCSVFLELSFLGSMLMDDSSLSEDEQLERLCPSKSTKLPPHHAEFPLRSPESGSLLETGQIFGINLSIKVLTRESMRRM